MSETLHDTMKGLIKQAVEAKLTLWDATRAMEVALGSDVGNAEDLINDLAITLSSPDYVDDNVTESFMNHLELEGQ